MTIFPDFLPFKPGKDKRGEKGKEKEKQGKMAVAFHSERHEL